MKLLSYFKSLPITKIEVPINTSVRVAMILSTTVIVIQNAGCQSLPQISTNPGNDSNSAVSEETRSDQAKRLFTLLDVNNDGVISKEEARAGFRYIIASYDRPKANEMLAATSGKKAKTKKHKPKRRPTAEDADRAFDALFVKGPTKVGNGLTEEEFETLVVKASDNPESDPFLAFL